MNSYRNEFATLREVKVNLQKRNSSPFTLVNFIEHKTSLITNMQHINITPL